MSRRTAQVDAYIGAQPAERQKALETLRELVLEVAPQVVETVRYRMPTYVMGEAIVCAFAAQKRYLSLYLEVPVLERFRSQLDHLNLGKSCIRFRHLQQLPLELVRRMLQETVSRLAAEQAPAG